MREKELDELERKRQFRDLLPFYVNGTLDETQHAYIDKYIAENSDARAELHFAERMMGAARLHGERRDPMAGYALLKKRMDASRPASGPAAWLRAWRERLHGWGLAPGPAALAAFLAVQLTVVGALFVPGPELVTTRGVATSAATMQRAQIKLTLKPGAAFGEVVALLVRHGCKIVWGPTPAGELWLALDEPRDAARIRASLAQSALVEDALELTQP